MSYTVDCYECGMQKNVRNRKQAEDIQKIHRNVVGHISCFVNRVKK
ncbi:MAG: hypothetical protein M0R17_06995 [Candidatus Omnitrophica bacterium]|jgi:hypothetical protein|nr:hypothetical protein [Candidatus Omnitrophota bacterium]